MYSWLNQALQSHGKKSSVHGPVALQKEDGSYMEHEEQCAFLLWVTYFPDCKPDNEWEDNRGLCRLRKTNEQWPNKSSHRKC